MNFISETQLEENKKAVGERVEDGTVTVDKPLYEILKEQREKKEAEQKEKFRNLPPKALDEEELEFLQTIDKHRREQDKEAAEEERKALTQFQTAVLGRTVRVGESAKALSLPPQSAPGQVPGAKRKTEQGVSGTGRAKLAGLSGLAVGVVVQPKRSKTQANQPAAAGGPRSRAVQEGTQAQTQSTLRGGDGCSGVKDVKEHAVVHNAREQSAKKPEELMVPRATGLSCLAAYEDDDEDDDDDDDKEEGKGSRF